MKYLCRLFLKIVCPFTSYPERFNCPYRPMHRFYNLHVYLLEYKTINEENSRLSRNPFIRKKLETGNYLFLFL